MFQQKNKPDIQLNILIGGLSIERAFSVKYIGMYIDYKMNWSKHVQKIQENTIPLIGVLKRCTKLPKHTANLIFDAHIMVKIRYGILVWAHTP